MDLDKFRSLLHMEKKKSGDPLMSIFNCKGPTSPGAVEALSVSSIFCPDPETSDPNTDHMMDCLGLRFTWLHSLFDNSLSLLNFALKLRCASGLCPRDLEDYGCSCRYVAAGNPVDALDM
ncbi:hypothetical protein PAMP_005339 [Pampus punctatissimus]